MGRISTTDEHGKALRRVVAVLLALADLAERASGRSVAVRALVLWLLRPGEVLARDYLARLTQAGPTELTAVPLTDTGALEAIRVAASFRKLAAALAGLAADILASAEQAVADRCGSRLPGLLSLADPPAPRRGPATAVGRLDSS